MDIKDTLSAAIVKAAQEAIADGVFPAGDLPDIVLEVPPKKEFGDLCETNRRQFVHYEAGLNVPDLKIAREHDAYLRGVEYLTTISMLSKSYAFVGGRTSGSVGAMLLSDGYKSTYVFDLGRYGTDKNW